MTEKKINMLISLMKASEDIIYATLDKWLKKLYGELKVHSSPNNYIYAEGELPVCLVAHIDTVSNKPIIPVYVPERNVIVSGLAGNIIGADDRAGVFAIVNILNAGYRPSVIFTSGEEIGGVGAEALIIDFEKPAVPTNFIIELDRGNRKDVVYYDTHNPDFEKYIEKYGFDKSIGTFSDISVITPVWDIASCNVSIGYKHEHTQFEILYISWMEETIRKITSLLNDVEQHGCQHYDSGILPMERGVFTCSHCGRNYKYYDLVVDDDQKPICMRCFLKILNGNEEE